MSGQNGGKETEAPQRPGEGHTDPPTSPNPPSAAAAQGPAASHTAPLRGNTRETPSRRAHGDARGAEGATIAEIVAATGWQPHTVRGAFAGALKKRLGLTVTSEKREGRGRVYRIAR